MSRQHTEYKRPPPSPTHLPRRTFINPRWYYRRQRSYQEYPSHRIVIYTTPAVDSSTSNHRARRPVATRSVRMYTFGQHPIRARHALFSLPLPLLLILSQQRYPIWARARVRCISLLVQSTGLSQVVSSPRTCTTGGARSTLHSQRCISRAHPTYHGCRWPCHTVVQQAHHDRAA